jgi:lipoprotein-anchoring transpeptidase ErfK/SrfK
MQHPAKICLGATLLFFAAQLPTLAQTTQLPITPLPVNSNDRPTPTHPLPQVFAAPDLPSIEPILPEANATRLILKLRERRVYVYQGDELKASYAVAIGKPGWETPTGQFHILEMVQNPGWTNPFTQEVIPPGAESPLGERWIAFWTDGQNYIGFNGTPDRQTVGQAASHGCVRMFNEDIRKLYDWVEVGTTVTVEQ